MRKQLFLGNYCRDNDMDPMLQTVVCRPNLTSNQHWKQRWWFVVVVLVQSLHNSVLVSATQQCESATCTHISSLPWISFPFVSPQSPVQSSLCYTASSHQLSILYIVSKVYICQSPSPSYHSPSFLGTHTLVLYICVSYMQWNITQP